MFGPETEIVDSIETVTYEGSVSGTGYVDLNPSGRVVRYVVVMCPKDGPNQNDFGRYLRFSLDGGTKWVTVSRNCYIGLAGRPTNDTLRIMGDGVSGTVGYEAVMGVDIA